MSILSEEDRQAILERAKKNTGRCSNTPEGVRWRWNVNFNGTWYVVRALYQTHALDSLISYTIEEHS